MKNHTACRVCKSTGLEKYLDLGMMPLSNNLLPHWTSNCETYPLQVMFCPHCYLSQLSVVIEPEILFGHYVYRSSISDDFRKHCRLMAKELKTKLGLNESSFQIDIAGNDGALLHEFKQEIGHLVLNVDPATNLAEYNEEKGIRYYKKFWGYKVADHLNYSGWPDADLITATNVFAHVDNVEEFLRSCDQVLVPDGVIVLEFPYLIDFIQKNEFDTVYFEHLSYFSITPLKWLCDNLQMPLLDVQHIDIHGGSVRCFIGSSAKYSVESSIRQSSTVNKFIQAEKINGYYAIAKYKFWEHRVRAAIENFRNRMEGLSEQSFEVWGFAASAKGNVLLNAAKIKSGLMPCIIDQTPEKLDKYSPGTGIRIRAMPKPGEHWPDYLVILSWNFADEIKHKCRVAGYRGKFIMPLTFEVYA